MNKEKKEFIESLNNDDLEMTSSFKDIMSRSDLKRRKKEKELENTKSSQDVFNNTEDEKLELTNTFNDIINKSEHKKNSGKSNEIDDNLKKDKETNLKKDKKNKELKKIEKKKNKELKKQNVANNKNGPFLGFILLIIFLCSAGYLVYNLLFNKSDPNQLYLIVNSGSIALLSLLFGLALKISKKPLKTIVQIFASILFLIYIAGTILISFDILKFPSKVTIENFANKNVTEALKWADDNDIDLDISYDYSDTIEKNLIISQDVEPNTLASEVDGLGIVVSDGPNYDLKVEVPNMVGWHIDDVVEKIEELKLNNVNIEYEFSDTIERDIAYEQSKDGEMVRKTEIEMKFSLGNEEDLKPVELIDLKDMKEFYATLWLKRNGIKYEIKYEYSDTVEYGKVIKTDPEKGTTIDQSKDKVELTISKGKKVIAPDLTKMSLEEIIKWANENHLTITYDSEYDDTIKAGNVKRTSVKEGDILDQSKTIHIILSKGKLKMIDYDKNDLDKVKKFASENNVPIEIVEEYNEKVAKGQIISISHKSGQVIKNSDTIKVVVSKGKATKIPNFVGLTTSEAKNTCNNSNLSCYFEYAYSTQTKGTVIYQNKTSGLEVIEGSGITLTISNGPAPSGQSNYVPPTTSSGSNSSSNSSGSSGSSGGNNSSSGGNTPSTPTCYNKTLYYGAGSTGTQTKQMLESVASQNGLSFSYQFVTSCSNGDSANGAICPESSIYYGMSASTCKTYNVIIVNY